MTAIRPLRKIARSASRALPGIQYPLVFRIRLEWASVGSAVSHGPDYRFGGIRISRASGVNAGAIDNWTLADYAA